MKKILSLVLLAAFAITSLAYVPTTTSAAEVSGTVILSGSTSVNPLIQALGEAFMAKNPNVKIVEQNVTGSGSGISDAKNLNSNVDFGMSSRNLTADEAKVLNKYQICLDGLAVVVNKSNPLDEISPAQLYKIYTRDTSDWNQISGSYSKSVKIAAFGREAGSGTRSCFEDFFKVDYGTALPSGYDVKLDGSLSSTGVIQTSVQKNTGGIGYMSLGDMDDSKVKALKIEGVEPSKYTVADGTYAIKRPFLLVFNKDKKISAASQAFVDYIGSSEGQAIIDKMGFIKNNLMKIKVNAVALRSSSVKLAIGSTYSLLPTVVPDTATDASLSYTTSDASVATVSTTGKITAVKKGTATITVKTNDGSNITKTCKVTVADAVSSVKLDKTSATLAVKKTLTLKATVAPSTAANKSVTWTSSDYKIASVSSTGVVTGVKAGTATITVTTVDGKKKATCKITVK